MEQYSYGPAIRLCRKHLGLTQEELARRSGISVMSLRRYESGERKPNIKTLRKIAEALDVEIYGLPEDDAMQEYIKNQRPFIGQLPKEALITPNLSMLKAVALNNKASTEQSMQKRSIDDLDSELLDALLSLTKEEDQRVLDFIAGLKAQR